MGEDESREDLGGRKRMLGEIAGIGEYWGIGVEICYSAVFLDSLKVTPVRTTRDGGYGVLTGYGFCNQAWISMPGLEYIPLSCWPKGPIQADARTEGCSLQTDTWGS